MLIFPTSNYMKYLIDTNSLSENLIKRLSKSKGIFIIQDVLDEYSYSKEDEKKILETEIKVVHLDKKHYEWAVKILEKHGDNLSLIRLFTNKGKADILILAYILAEREDPEKLFVDEYTIITKDGPLKDAANEYGINCVEDI